MANRSRNFPALPFLLSSSLAMAQMPGIPFSGGGFSDGPNGIKGDATFNLSRTIQVKANAPYSGEDKRDTVQTLADGTHITRSTSHGIKIWRDSQGRVRIEQGLGGHRGPYSHALVEIEDPVAGYVYILDEMNKVAHRVKANVVPERNLDPMAARRPAQTRANGTTSTVAPAPAAGSPAPGATGRAEANPSPRPQNSGPDDLGTSVIDGLPVRGSRTTTVVPIGLVGNDRPMTTTRDTWYSPDLNLVISTVITDPQSGVQTSGIGNLSLSDPDPSLFTVPVDYQLVDESSSTFTIKWDTTGAQQTGR
jgi:hypothetical protein